MRHREDPTFWRDWRQLGRRDRGLFHVAVRAINEAYAQRGSQTLPTWPASLRVRHLVGHTGVYEMTWSFAGPDGRATFELVVMQGEPAIKWRRIGGHEIFARP